MSDRDSYFSPDSFGGFDPEMSGQTCPRCSVSTISPRTGKCELCGFAPGSVIAVVAEDAVAAAASRELAHEFQIGELLGRGRGTAVYRVKERGSGREVVLKVIARRSDIPDAEEAFRAMLGMFVGFEHPHLAPVMRYGSTDSLYWYTSEDVGASTLRRLLAEHHRLDARRCRRIGTQIVAALDYLHRHGIVHGAIKLDNILLDKDGWVRVSDPSFIRARWKRRSRTDVTRRDSGPGSVDQAMRAPWVAPEDHERGERLPAADQYAVGALLYECLTGLPPDDPPLPLLSIAPDVPAQMARAIDTALQPVPFKRFASCSEFIFALEEASATGEIQRVPARAPARTSAATPAPQRPSQDVAMIRGWEPPPALPANRLMIVGRVSAVVLTAAALWWSAPIIIRILFPPPTEVVSSPAPPIIDIRSGTPPANPPLEERSVPVTPAPRAAPRPAQQTSPNTAAPVTPPAAPAREPAKLFVNSTPWGVLYVDGTLIGNTPRTNVEISPGEHTIRVIRPGFGTVERTVRLAPGEILRLTDIVLVPERP